MKLTYRPPRPPVERPLLKQRLDPVDSPFVVAVDSREKAPLTFQGMFHDVSGSHHGAPINVRRQWATLPAGDYSIVGHETDIAIERKSLADLYGTLAGHRLRFEREHEKLARYDFAAVVIEATWMDVLRGPPCSRLNPKTVFRTAVSWSQRYGVHWWAVDGRRFAEVVTYRMLEMWWRQRQQGRLWVDPRKHK